MKALALFFLTVATAAAGTGSLNERYTAWNYAVEIQARNAAAFGRPREVVDVGLAIPADRAGNLRNDLRVVLKQGFDLLVKEIPAQIYDLKTEGGRTSFRVVFCADFPPDSTERFAVFYDNPGATEPLGPAGVAIRESGRTLSIDAPAYSVQLDVATGRCLALQSKVPAPQTVYRQPEGVFPLPTITVLADGAGEGGLRILQGTAIPGQHDEILAGPVFSTVKGHREFGAPRGGPLAAVEFTYLFFPEEPYFVVQSSLRFLRDTAVCAVEMNRFAADRREFTHYFFRPVTPTFSPTEIEEVGSILVDADRRRGFPEGDLLAGLLPIDMAWQAVGNIDRGFAVTGYNLFSHRRAPDGAAPLYRPSTRARVRSGLLEWSNAPIYVGVQGTPSNTIAVRKGTMYEEAQAISFSGWNNGDWRSVTDLLGRRLNTAVEVTVYPRACRAPDNLPVLPHHGERSAAYERSGIR